MDALRVRLPEGSRAVQQTYEGVAAVILFPKVNKV